MSAPVVSFDVVTFHARGAWPRWDGFDMTHSADGFVTLASGEIVSFACSRHHKPGEGTDIAATLYSASRRELTAAKWESIRAAVRSAFIGHVRTMAEGPRPACIKPGTKTEADAMREIAHACERGDCDADEIAPFADSYVEMIRQRIAPDTADAAEAALAGLDSTSYASPVVRPRVGGFATSGNIAPIGRAYRDGTLDSFMVAAILDWMRPARLAAFFARWGAPARD